MPKKWLAKQVLNLTQLSLLSPLNLAATIRPIRLHSRQRVSNYGDRIGTSPRFQFEIQRASYFHFRLASYENSKTMRLNYLRRSVQGDLLDAGSIPAISTSALSGKVSQAAVAELVDALDLKSNSSDRVRVRFPPAARMRVSYNGYYFTLPRQRNGFDSRYPLQITKTGFKACFCASKKAFLTNIIVFN